MPRVVAHVAIDHRLHVDGGAQQAADVFDFAIRDRLVAHPAREDGFDRQLQLLERVLREVLPVVLLVDFLVRLAELLQALRRHIGVVAWPCTSS